MLLYSIYVYTRHIYSVVKVVRYMEYDVEGENPPSIHIAPCPFPHVLQLGSIRPRISKAVSLIEPLMPRAWFQKQRISYTLFSWTSAIRLSLNTCLCCLDSDSRSRSLALQLMSRLILVVLAREGMDSQI